MSENFKLKFYYNNNNNKRYMIIIIFKHKKILENLG